LNNLSVIPAGSTIDGLRFIQDWRIEVRPSHFMKGYLIVSDGTTMINGVGVLWSEALKDYVTNLRAYLIQNWLELPAWVRVGFRVVKQ
jgi:hypothetical protein